LKGLRGDSGRPGLKGQVGEPAPFGRPGEKGDRGLPGDTSASEGIDSNVYYNQHGMII